MVLEAVRGSFLDGRGPNDVTHLFVLDEHISYFLKDTNVFFPQLKAISWYHSELQSLTADDLQPYPNLISLGLWMNNLVALDGDIFLHTLKLQYIDFDLNSISSVGVNILDGLLDLKIADFSHNNCIDNFANTEENLASLKRNLTAQCPSTWTPPTVLPTIAPTLLPTVEPTSPPTVAPTLPPTIEPTVPLTIAPTLPPTVEPTSPPTVAPTLPPTIAATEPATEASTLPPTLAPTLPPTMQPTLPPTTAPTDPVTEVPTMPPTTAPSTTDRTTTISPCRRQCDIVTGGGTIPSRTNCRRYYECDGGMQYPRTCSGNLIFDARSGVCLDAGSATCVIYLDC